MPPVPPPVPPFHLAFPVTSLANAFRGEVGEQATMFLLDPCGNAVEIKAFRDIGRLFTK